MDGMHGTVAVPGFWSTGLEFGGGDGIEERVGWWGSRGADILTGTWEVCSPKGRGKEQ